MALMRILRDPRRRFGDLGPSRLAISEARAIAEACSAEHPAFAERRDRRRQALSRVLDSLERTRGLQ